MERDVRAYILDIRENCDLILDFVNYADLGKYKANELMRFAVERRFIVIGEARSRLKQLDFTLSARFPMRQGSLHLGMFWYTVTNRSQTSSFGK